MKEMARRSFRYARCAANGARPRRGDCGQRGAVAVIFAGSLAVLIGFIGLALDLSRVYNRKAEMQGLANTIAIAAAKRLNGTAAGIDDARAAARDIVETSPYKPSYNYTAAMAWSDTAIQFGQGPDGGIGGWLDSTAASAAPGALMYVRVDTRRLNPEYGNVNLYFMPVLPSTPGSVDVGHVAVAGKSRLSVTPLGICAMSPTAAAQRSNPSGNNELIEYGFRRGVSYDLMNLNSQGTARANFLIDPISKPGSGSAASNFDLATVGPYVCTGTVALPKITGGSVSVQAGFPIGSLFNHLNSRFALYGGQCDPNAAPPDSNVKQYPAATLGWMNPKPTLQAAKPYSGNGILQTIADPVPAIAPTQTLIGPLWAYARAVPWSSAGQTEPASGYTPFAATQAIWNSLYNNGPTMSSYPAGAASTPYFIGGAYGLLPPTAYRPGIKNRRVLNIPLLACPVAGSVANVLAIGKFFMTVQADATTISAEFAGAASEAQLSGPVELY